MKSRMPQPIQRSAAQPVPARPAVSRPGDACECEADRVADQVMRMRRPVPRTGGGRFGSAQNFAGCAEGDGRKTRLQKKELFAGSPAAALQNSAVPPVVHEALRSGGEPLPPATQQFMESRFNHDFSQVRVHADRRAAESARAINALAYTAGRDVVFGAEQFSPDTSAGCRLLAHELTHVVQQSETPDRLPAIQRQTGFNSLLTSPLTPVSGFNLPVKSVEFETPETISATNPKLVELVSAYKTAGFGATIRLSADFTEAAKLSSAKQKEESAQMLQRLRAVRDALTVAGVPAEQVSLSPPTAFATSAKGQVTADVMGSAPVSGLNPPTASPPTLTPPTVPPSKPAAPSKSLGDMLSFKFKAGSAEFAIDLPKSATAKLPVALSAGKALSFELKAETSGTFSFSVTLDGVPHVRVRLEAKASVSKDKGTSGSAGLVIETTRTICHAPSPESLKTDITKAGDDLKKALDAAQAATTNEDKLSKLVDVAGAIGDMYGAVDKAKKSCKEEPAATFRFGVQGPLSPPPPASPEETDPSKRPATFVGGSATWYF